MRRAARRNVHRLGLVDNVRTAALGGDFYTANIACRDNVDASELAAAKVRYSDGRDNNWENEPKETRYL